ncbi:MAG: histidine phosphatase family protein [Desulfomonilaceae bacterium]
MSLQIILARHGQTCYNREGVIQGRSDSPLTHTGIAETQKMPNLISQFKPRAIYSSSLGRAAFSSSIYSQTLAIPIYFMENLAELSCGQWEGSRRTDVVGHRGLIRSDWFERPPGGESYQDGEERIRYIVDELYSFTDDSCKIVLAHAGLNRSLVKLILGLNEKDALLIRFPHDTVYLIHSDKTVKHLGLTTGSGNGFLREID